MTAIIDSKAMAYLELHANKPVVNLFETVANCLGKVENLYGPVGKIFFAYDIGKSRYRLDLWENYKGKRTYATIPSDFKEHYEKIVPRIATALGIANFMPFEVEADDIAGILCGKIKEPVVLLTVDFDWESLVLRHDHVHFFDVKKYTLLDKPSVIKKTKCYTEDQFSIKKCVVGDSGDNIIGVPAIGPVKYQRWADEIFQHPRALELEFLKEEFLKLCHKPEGTHKAHRDYMYAGVHSCEELLDYNLKLGTIMRDLSLLDVEQKVAIKQAYLTSNSLTQDIDRALSLSQEFNGGAIGPFGDPYSLSPVALDYYKEVYERSK
jgi:5'-3' exonuclease